MYGVNCVALTACFESICSIVMEMGLLVKRLPQGVGVVTQCGGDGLCFMVVVCRESASRPLYMFRSALANTFVSVAGQL